MLWRMPIAISHISTVSETLRSLRSPSLKSSYAMTTVFMLMRGAPREGLTGGGPTDILVGWSSYCSASPRTVLLGFARKRSVSASPCPSWHAASLTRSAVRKHRKKEAPDEELRAVDALEGRRYLRRLPRPRGFADCGVCRLGTGFRRLERAVREDRCRHRRAE